MHRIKYIKNRMVQKAAAVFILDLLFFGNINTSKVAQFVLIVGYVLLVSNLYMVIYGSISLIKLYGGPVKVKRKRQLSIYISAIVALMVALQSIGELSTKDVVVVCMLAVISYGYMNYAKINEQKIP